MLKKINVISLYCVSTLVFAQPASLDAEFALQIPLIEFGSGADTHYYWANLEQQKQANNPLTFTVTTYGELQPESVPPNLYQLANVTEGDGPVITDITATNARLHFVSTVPLACSVMYGTSLEFGSIATDSSMNGGAITEHNPILSGLNPDSTYFYRVQGSDAQGRLYWSPVASFNTLSASAAADANLLSLNNGAYVASVSSNYGGGSNQANWGANSALDDSSATAWSSAGDGDQAFIEVALAKSTWINSVQVWSRSMADGSAKILSFNLILDNDAVLGPFELPDTQQAYTFALNKSTSSLRLEVVSSTGGNTGLIEFSAY
ncbi:hypothetical protein AU255_00480 [Methyloprofundus sedimenti]|uniref:F5/8 type C domain-containing protein n=1 Tax=Methyloprofundus sedimenti TaxID=1420851 RepID=A0A1V8M4E6_9GAMM|nr:fibronectin type III domain-containing protein [Methyloprofundus sedimenti]OQK16421.1 hypothetical protein AU255_00480 [Methyloprofundus sedimenti]